jgi:hypothetical protein
MKHAFLLLLISALALTACGGPSTPLPSPPTSGTQLPSPVPTYSFSDLTITFEREMCDGTCPAYKLTIQGDGTLIYEGEAYVAVEGVRTSQIGPEKVEQLVAAFEEAGFFGLDNLYAVPVTDMPGSRISITMNGQTKEVYHHGFCGDSALNTAPPELCALEERIDLITNSAQWTGR